MNLIDEYFEIVKVVLDAPDTFIKASGYSLVSNLLGRYFTAFDMPYGRPNLWFLISSIPGRYRRSTLASYYNHGYTQALTEYYKLKAQGQQTREQAEEVKKLIDMSSIEEGTPEGIADQITECTEKKITTLSIFSAEWGGILKRMSELGYMSGTLNLLSKLYYGEGGRVHLSLRSGGKPRYIPEGLYVTMFTGMQEPELYLTPPMVRQGTLRRIILDYEKHAERWLKPVRLGYNTAYNQITEWSHKVANLMIEYEKKLAGCQTCYLPKFSFLHLFMNHDVVDIINLRAQELDSAIDKAPTLENIYRQSLWEHLAKLAMNRCIAEGIFNPTRPEDMPNMSVKLEHILKAKEFLDVIENRMSGVINALGEQPVVMRSHRNPLEVLYGVIQQNNGLTKTMVHRKCPNWMHDQVTELLETLQAQGRITAEIKRDGKGAPSTCFSVVDEP